MPTETVASCPASTEESDAIVKLEEKINWYYSPIDKQVFRQLMERSDARGFRQVGLHLGLIVLTGTAAFYAWQQHAWGWMILALFAHGSVYGFLGGGVAGHELTHRTVFKSRFWNDCFAWMSSIMGYGNHVFFRTSHVKHHQLTVYKDLDLEVVLPAKLTWQSWVYALTINPMGVYKTIKVNVRRSLGRLDGDWEHRIFPESNPNLRRAMFNCSRVVLLTHLVLAAVFIYFHLWVMFLLVTLAPFYAGWLQMLCGFPQHAGLQSSVPDFRLSCRTVILHPFPAFLYWQMNYHIEHHMYPAIPFYNLPKLHEILKADMPPAPRGFWACWKQLLPVIRRQKTDPNYVFVPQLPNLKTA